MIEIKGLRRSIKLRMDVKIVIFTLLCAAIFAVFMESSLSVYLGPIIAAGMVYLFFNGYMELITAMIVVAKQCENNYFYIHTKLDRTAQAFNFNQK